MGKNAVYTSNGNLVELLYGDGNVGLEELTVNTVDASKEKHVPAIERNGDEVTVKVGSVAHPMVKGHYITFIEVLDGDYVYRKNFKEEGEAVATFKVKSDKIVARAFCNTHGFWSAEG